MDALHLLTKEVTAQLASNHGWRQSSRFTGRGEIDVELAFSKAEGILYVVGAVNFCIACFHRIDRLKKRGVVFMRKFKFDVCSSAEEVGNKRQSFDTGYGSYFGAPKLF